jgi:hypothetical protein
MRPVTVEKHEHVHEAGREVIKTHPIVLAMDHDRYRRFEAIWPASHRMLVQDGELPGHGCYVFLTADYSFVAALLVGDSS